MRVPSSETPSVHPKVMQELAGHATSAITTEEFDRRIDDGEDMEEFLDMEHPVVHRAKAPRVVLNPPAWLLEFYDAEAEHRGIARKAAMNIALVEWADEQRERQKALASA